MTLYQTLQNELQNHDDFWNYYGVQFDEILSNEKTAREFIYRYFKRGSKATVLDAEDDLGNRYVQTRNLHAVNVFFIGAFLQRMIDENLAIRSEHFSNYPFSYLWFLLCLAHDFGYKYEKNSSLYIDIPESSASLWDRKYNTVGNSMFTTRGHWYREHIIDIPYLSPAFGSRGLTRPLISERMRTQDGHIVYNNETVIKHPRYSQRTKDNYFRYRLRDWNTLDHGIIGADVFYSKLIMNYITEYRKMRKRASFTEPLEDFHNEQGLHFCSEQLKIFAYIADCIASHNVYKAGDDQEGQYRQYGLECLLPGQFRPISYKDNPLLFVLCVADTIEPSKRFPRYRNAELLNLISIDYDVNTNALHIEVDEKLYNHRKVGPAYVASIEELGDWCDIRTSVTVTRL